MFLPTYIRSFLLCYLSILILGSITTYAIEKNGADNQLYSLNIKLDNIRNTKGNLFIFIYKYENQYPFNPELHFEILKKNIVEGKLTYIVNNLAKGKYAISLLDDENANKDLDRFLGIPCEGFGFSNNIRPLLSLPDYEELLFEIDNSKTINLTLQYFL